MAPDASTDIGHNSQVDVDLLHDRLHNEFQPLKDRRDELIAACERIPGEIKDEETAGRVADQIKQVSACIKTANGSRAQVKQPYLDGGRLVDTFFKGVTDPLDKAKKDVQQKLTVWERAKAAEERRRREEAERKAREEAEAARKAAEEAAAKLESDDDLNGAIDAEEAANQAAADAARAEKEADAKAAALHTTRGDYGASSSLRTFWSFRNLNRDAIDLNALRPHLPQDALEKAVRAYIKAGGRQLTGVEIFEDTQSVVR